MMDRRDKCYSYVEVIMKIKEVMSDNVETVSSGATLEQAASKMKSRDVGFLPVLDGAKIVGVITDRDIVLHAVAAGLRPHMTTVREAMTTKGLHCYDDYSLSDASLMMEKNHVRRLVVLDRSDHLVGIISLSDFAVKTHNDRLSGHVLGKVATAA